MVEKFSSDSLQTGLDSLLREVRALLERQRVVENLVSRQEGPKQHLVQTLTERQHLAEMQKRLAASHPADVAFVLQSLPVEDRMRVWNQVWHQRGGAILLELSTAFRKSVLSNMNKDEVISLLQQIGSEDLSDLSDCVPQYILEEVYHSLDSQAQSDLVSSIAYPEESVGQLMSQKVITVKPDRTIQEVIEELRGKDLPSLTDHVYVTDARHTLVGILPLTKLLFDNPQSVVRDLVAESPAFITPYMSADDAVKMFERYDLVSAPVVDERNKLVGRITVDAVIDFSRRRADEDALKRAGLQGEEDIFASVWASARNRWFWLAVNLVTAFLASRVIGLYEAAIGQLVALAALMPIVASIGGNTGNQTVALIVRGLALDHVTRANLVHLLLKEIRVSLLNGLVWGGFMGLLTMILYRNFSLGVVMAAAMLLNLLVAALVGVVVPLVLERFGYDPAQGSSVLLTFTTDSMGFFIFLGLASAFLL